MLAYTYIFYQSKSDFNHQDPPNYSNTNTTINDYCPQSYNFQIQDLVLLHEFSRFGNIIDFHFQYSPRTLGFLPSNHREGDSHSHLLAILINLPLHLKLENFLELFQEIQLLVIKLILGTT